MAAAGSDIHTDFLEGTGQMGALIRSFDWDATPLGPIALWPASLKTSVSLILNSRHPMWIGWGPEMTFLYNDAYLHVLGPAKHPGALGRPASEVWAEIWDVCGPLANKVFTLGEATFVDDVRLFMDRGTFLEETFYSFSYSPIRDESGRVTGLFCPSTDVTPKVLHARRLHTLSVLAARALTEKTTEAACAAAAQILNGNPDDVPFALLYLANASGTRASIQQKVGYFSGNAPEDIDLTTASETCPWPVKEVFESGQRQVVDVTYREGLPRGIAGQRVSHAVVLPVASLGENKPYGVLIAGVNPCRPLDANHFTFFELIAGQFATAIQNARAKEEEKKRLELLAEIDRAKTTFFSNVSHEFRTPLTLMLGPIEALLAHTEGLRREDREQLAIAHRNSLRLLKLVNSLLDFSRIEAGRLKARFAPTGLSQLTRDLAAGFRSTMEAAGIELIVDCEPLSEPVYADRDMWEQIVLNLLSNAFKFTFEGCITVRMRAQGSNAELTVADTGIGIPEAELPRIFERFHRVEGARGRTYEGTGIGLSLVDEFVKLHGGHVSVTSRLGQGSTFTVSLPFGKAHLPSDQIAESTPARPETGFSAAAFTEEALNWLPHPGAAENHERTPPAAGLRPRILLADDNADMRKHVLRILGPDYDLTAVANGAQALESIRKDPPDLVLTDVMMPRMDGLKLLRALRSAPETQTLPVIFMSARAGEEARIEGLQTGADDHLAKPFTANELKARVARQLDMARLRRRAAERELALRHEAEAARDKVISVLESITDGFISLDKDWRITYVNAEAERLNGMRRHELLGKNHWDLFAATVGTTVHRELLRAVAERTPVEFENYYAPWKRWFHVKAYPTPEGGLSVFFEDISARKAAESERNALLVREQEARETAETLNEIARALSGELDLQKLVQTATDAATKFTGAQFGAFFHNLGEGGQYQLYTLSGAPRQAFEKFGMPRKTSIFGVTFGGKVLRSDDITQHPDYGKNPPYQGMPPGHLPVRSYLAVPVVGRSGDILGAMFFGHPQPGVFTSRSERTASGIASIAAAAIDNARLFEKANQEISQRQRVESALRESEKRFRDMVDSLPAAVYTTDTEGRLTHYNSAAITLSGRVPELGRDQWCVTWKLFRPDGTPLPHSESPMAVALKEKRAISGAECIAETPGGRRFWIAAYSTPMFDTQGHMTGGINMLVDITERKEAEKTALLLKAIVDSSDDAIIGKNLDGIIVSWNAGAERLYQYKAEEVLGKSITIIVPPDRFDEETRILAKLQRGESISHFETIRRRKDGTLLHVSLTISPIRDSAGRIIGASKIARDITERKRAEAALLESEARFRQLADSMPQIVWTARPDGYVDYYNQRWYEFTGFTPDRFGVESWAAILHPEDLPGCIGTWYESVRTGAPYQSEYRFWDRRELRWRWFMGRALPIRNASGAVVKWFGTSTDIDAQKRVERELRQANLDLQQFAYSATHDLKEPLRTVRIYTELLARRYGHQLDGEALEFCKYAHNGARHMETLVQDLLEYAQLGKIAPPREAIDANDALKDAIAWLAGAITESRAQITADALPFLRVHNAHLKQLFQNLIGNAIKYRKPGHAPVIHIGVTATTDVCTISVADNGIGIDPEYKEQVFGLFKRLHAGDEYSGTGIGLAICQRIVERYQGRIWVESKPGEGSIFFFTLPR
jgi:PAS domain S-box-containing protein